MLIVLVDEPGLFVFASPEAAALGIELPDAVDEVRAAYDEHVPYRADPGDVPWRIGCTVAVRPYRWIAAGPVDRDGLAQLIRRHGDLVSPPEAGLVLQELLATLPR
jgi:hypothetical protein